MEKPISRASMYQDNIIAVKYVHRKQNYTACNGLAGEMEIISKDIERICYLKICWNCGSSYESHRYNSYACRPKCRQNLAYRLKHGIRPAIRMEHYTKAKNVESLRGIHAF